MTIESNNYPLRIPAVRVRQPLGEFYVTSLQADYLAALTYADPLKVVVDPKYETGEYALQGIQREESKLKLKEISRFIETTEAAFPNSIILAVNYNQEGILEEDDAYRWKVESDANTPGIFWLIIPTPKKLASIVDGQHRLRGFEDASPNRKLMDLPCSIYIDLPNPYQAYLFATINFNQKKVSRSLAYSLFGYNIDQEDPKEWSPEKSAVFMARKLNTDAESALRGRIVIAAQNEEILKAYAGDSNWVISLATIVDGILRLFSKNPKSDRDTMHLKEPGTRSRSSLTDDATPLRKLYLDTNDLVIYTIISNYLTAVKLDLWPTPNPRSFIFKTVGIQALFDFLRSIVRDVERDKDISVNKFRSFLGKATQVDFTDNFFQASGQGRSRILNCLLILNDKKPIDPEDSWATDYQRLLFTSTSS